MRVVQHLRKSGLNIAYKKGHFYLTSSPEDFSEEIEITEKMIKGYTSKLLALKALQNNIRTHGPVASSPEKGETL